MTESMAEKREARMTLAALYEPGDIITGTLPTLGDELANLGIGILIRVFVFALPLCASGAVAAWATRRGQPAGGPEAVLAVLLNPGNPSAAVFAPEVLAT